MCASSGRINLAPMVGFKNPRWSRFEVASRGNTPERLQQKVNDCLQHGAGEVIIYLPIERTMVVFRPDGTALNITAEADYHCDLVGVTFTPEFRTAGVA
jgi:Uma2 family endonuclease